MSAEKAREHIEKSLTICTEIGDRNGEARCYAYLGAVYESVGEYEKAREHIKKSLTICTEIGHRDGEAFYYANLGDVYKLVIVLTKRLIVSCHVAIAFVAS